MGVIVLAEHQVHQLLVLIHQRKAVNLVLPDNIIGFLQGSGLVGINQIIQRCHKVTSASVISGDTLESLTTKPALYRFTL